MPKRWVPKIGEQVRHPDGVGVVRGVIRRKWGFVAAVFTGTRANGEEVVQRFIVHDLAPMSKATEGE